MQNNTLAHPIQLFTYFITAIIMGMFFIHPLFTVLSIACACTYLATLRGIAAVKALGRTLLLTAAITLINPVFNTSGRHVLFYIINRAYTIESLIYGFTLGSMAAAVLLWFSAYNEVMTSEKIIYLFGKTLPSLSLVLSMVLRLIPRLSLKSRELNEARWALGGKRGTRMSFKDRLKNGATVISALTAIALEGAMVSSDSMLARGYGTAKRTSYIKYSFGIKNILLFVVNIALCIPIIYCAAKGGVAAEFTPVLSLAWLGNRRTLICFICYAIFLLIPTVINLKELLLWHISRSRI